MTGVDSPVFNTLMKEIENARNIVSVLPDYRNTTVSLSEENQRLKDELAEIKSQSSSQDDKISEALEEYETVKAALLDAEIKIASLESDNEALTERLSSAEEARTRLTQANTNLNQVVMNHESTIRILKRELGQS